MKTDLLTHEKILSVIKELEQNPAITQRGLALKLKISLGKINYYSVTLIFNNIVIVRLDRTIQIAFSGFPLSRE